MRAPDTRNSTRPETPRRCHQCDRCGTFPDWFASRNDDFRNCPCGHSLAQGDEASYTAGAAASDQADLRIALSTSVLPSDQMAPGTLWLEAMTESNAVSIQRQSSSVMVRGGNSLMV